MSVEMLSGRKKRDYQADALATQAGATEAGEAGDENAISPNEAAEVGVMTVPDTADSDGDTSDEEMLVLA